MPSNLNFDSLPPQLPIYFPNSIYASVNFILYLTMASAIESAASHKKFTAEDAKELLREAEVLKPVLIQEGKMAAHRYSGPVERMETMAKACIAEGCGFFFI